MVVMIRTAHFVVRLFAPDCLLCSHVNQLIGGALMCASCLLIGTRHYGEDVSVVAGQPPGLPASAIVIGISSETPAFGFRLGSQLGQCSSSCRHVRAMVVPSIVALPLSDSESHLNYYSRHCGATQIRLTV